MHVQRKNLLGGGYLVSNISRRVFIKRSLAAGAISGMIFSGTDKMAEAVEKPANQVGTLIDLTKCDGCQGKDIPACVSACRVKNQSKFPEPIENIQNYWPQPKKEDWSDKRNLTKRLTPYNWTFVQNVKVDNQSVFIPRRCMHCDNPPCAKLCPFSAQEKTPEGPVLIDPNTCFGGAKCRTVCPWGIPARQAGVGLYLKVAPKLAGGGVMYKCDLCYDRIKQDQKPACVEVCPQKAILFGAKEEMRKLAQEKAKEINGYVYGEQENGGTSTFYISPVSFEKIDEQLKKQKAKQPNPQAPGFPTMPVNAENFLDSVNGMASSVLIAPVATAFAAGFTAYRTIKGKGDDHSEK